MNHGVGGVAVYRNKLSAWIVDFSHDIFENSVIFGIKDSNTIIAVLYLPASNSKYYLSNPVYFKNMETILKFYDNNVIYVIGDLNSRTGTPVFENTIYVDNPDPVINSHGGQLLNICKENECYIINSLSLENRCFDSKMTFFRGRVSSQNDICISNKPTNVRSFHNLKKMVMSDHTPCSLSVTVNSSTSTGLINDISASNFDDSHYDTNYTRKCIKVSNINAANVIDDFLELANYIRRKLNDKMAVNVDLLATFKMKFIPHAKVTLVEIVRRYKLIKMTTGPPNIIIGQNDNRTSKHYN